LSLNKLDRDRKRATETLKFTFFCLTKLKHCSSLPKGID
jgi:hypothetical protein